MRNQLRQWRRVALLVLIAAVPSIAQAQTAAAITGTVRDAGGLVIPGVTVEASSPALIERVRSVVTDGQGLYRIVDLRPGTYTVRFTLAGFQVVERVGLELSTGFTATVDAAMRVGAVEETITVTGASPTVDIVGVQTQNVLTREVLDTLPSGKTFAQFAMVTPGVGGGASGGVDTRDVGGVQGEAPLGMTAHGSDSGLTSVDGVMTVSMAGGDWRRLNMSDQYTEEVVVQVSGGNAENWTGGVNVNVIPKSGGNTFAGTMSASWTTTDLQSGNISDELRARGIRDPSTLQGMFDVGGGIGGPVVQDRLWFYVGPRVWRTASLVAGNYFNSTPHTLFYTPDLNQQAEFARRNWDMSGRVTWQVSRNQKLAVSDFNSYQCFCPFAVEGGGVSPDGAARYLYWPERMASGNWTYTPSSRVLLEGRMAWRSEGVTSEPNDGVLSTDRSVLELSINRRYGSHTGLVGPTDYGVSPSIHWLGGASMSYVTGSHSLKVGFSTLNASETLVIEPNFSEAYNFLNQVPVSLWQLAAPNRTTTDLAAFGLFAQDQWTVRRLTLNLGVRMDAIRGTSPAQTRPGGPYLGPIAFDKVENIPNLKSVHPRLGVAFDLFGTGKTALKAQVGRYEQNDTFSLSQTRANSPVNTLVLRTTRTWSDANGNFVPDCDLTNRLVNGECGALADQGFGTSRVSTRYDPNVLEGWNVSPHFWQSSVTLEHELLSNVGVKVGYFHTWHTNQTVTDNRAVTPADFDKYCVTTPANAQLPGGGGQQVCGFQDVSFAKFGQTDNFITHVSNFGGWSDTYDGVDATINARFGNGAFVTGGVSTGRSVADHCNDPDTPGNAFCKVTDPMSHQIELKLSGVYRLPGDVQASVIFQNLPGRARAVTYVATNALIAGSLGRNLSSCAAPTGACNANATVTVVEPNSFNEDRGHQTDLRLGRVFEIGGIRLRGNFDIYNLFNSSDVLSVNGRIGPTFLQPASILSGRLVKVGGQIEF